MSDEKTTGVYPELPASNDQPPPYVPNTNPPVITQQPQVVVVQQPEFDKEPVNITCAHCNDNITTKTDTETSIVQWLACIGCCLIGCDLGCCFIPFCIDDLKTTTHSCPKCNLVVGKRKVI